MENPIIELKNVSHFFTMGEDKKLKVLEDLNLSLNPGEVVVLLGPSGSGKSTCLRIMAGLLKPTHGEVLVEGDSLHGSNPLVSMVFQSFVLLPWLTVFENVEVGVESLKLPESEVRSRVKRAIDLVGLEGFEEAYPRELSGGMKQRVGIARALVMERPVLLLDEPFSALDVLTAESLRKEVLSIWLSKKTSTNTVLLVTHNIIEAASLGKRILVMGTHPGHVRLSIKNDLPYPRDERSAGFKSLVESIHDVITEAINPDTPEWVPPALAAVASIETLPPISINEIIGLLVFIGDGGGRANVFSIAHTLGKDFGKVLFSAKGAEMLNFVDTPKNEVVLTDLGKKFISGDVNLRKKLVHDALLELKVCQLIRDKLSVENRYTLPEEVILEFLQDANPNEDINRQFETLIQWARYGELFGYNAIEKELYLDIGQENA
jgi:NitT/TauT family transport system ATP-binding protein